MQCASVMKTKSIRTRSAQILTGVILAMSTVEVARAADLSNGANNFYKSHKVTAQKVTFKNQYNMTVAGNLFVPKGLKEEIKYPAIIVGHPMGAVKEQSANLHAQKLADQ